MISFFLANIFLAAVAAHLLVELPGAPPNNLSIYSGYLWDGRKGRIHYIFTKAEENPETSPLIIWMACQLGCSNYWPMFSSFGPFRINKVDQTLKINSKAWTKVANLLVIDVPGGIGYSLGYNPVIFKNDLMAIYKNVLEQFFINYPEHKQNDLYLAGSAASTWIIPSFIKYITELETADSSKLKGAIILNPAIGSSAVSTLSIAYMYYHGFVDEKNFRYLVSNCCNGDIDHCLVLNMDSECMKLSLDTTIEVKISGINPYNIYEPCQTMSPPSNFTRKNGGENDPPISASCQDHNEFLSYFNRPDVQVALEAVPDDWFFCNSKISFPEEHDEIALMKTLIDSGMKLLLLNGDSDIINPLTGTQQFSLDLGYEMKGKNVLYINTVVKGFLTEYAGFDFGTILGGDYLCSNKADVMLHFIRTFLEK